MGFERVDTSPRSVPIKAYPFTHQAFCWYASVAELARDWQNPFPRPEAFR